VASKVFIAVLAKQKEKVLPLFLRSLYDLNYPKEDIALYVRTNNNTDNTQQILDDWLKEHRAEYHYVHYDNSDIADNVEQYGVHEWNGVRFRALAKIRQASLDAFLRSDCDYYFVIDVDNFLFPETLKDLIEANKPIIAPLLRYAVATDEFPDTPEDQERVGSHKCRYYSNYHHMVDDYGSILNEPVYYQLLHRVEGYKGIWDVDCVHCTYLIKREYVDKLSYLEDSDRWEYMVFSESARKARINQYLDNRKIYGILTLTENGSMCEWLFDHLKDPATRDERYQQHNPQDIFYTPERAVILSE
jgi:hypothetical protein